MNFRQIERDFCEITLMHSKRTRAGGQAKCLCHVSTFGSSYHFKTADKRHVANCRLSAKCKQHHVDSCSNRWLIKTYYDLADPVPLFAAAHFLILMIKIMAKNYSRIGLKKSNKKSKQLLIGQNQQLLGSSIQLLCCMKNEAGSCPCSQTVEFYCKH